MEDLETARDTPGTISFAASGSQDASGKSTRASTPTENRAKGVLTDAMSLEEPSEQDGVTDVTMGDVVPETKLPAGAANDFGNSKVLTWPSGTAIDSGPSPPWKAGRTKDEPFSDISDPRKLEELLQFDEPDSPSLYRP